MFLRAYSTLLFVNIKQDIFLCYRYRKLADKLRPLVKDTVYYLYSALREGRSVLVEGANAAMLDIDFGSLKLSFVLRNRHKNKIVIIHWGHKYRYVSICYKQ